jgi:hypothetical protein
VQVGFPQMIFCPGYNKPDFIQALGLLFCHRKNPAESWLFFDQKMYLLIPKVYDLAPETMPMFRVSGDQLG